MKNRLIEWIENYKNEKWMLFTDQLVFRFNVDNVSSIGSQLAFYLVLSIFPFLIFLLNIVQFTPLASDDVLNSLVSVLPGNTQSMIKTIINNIIKASSGTLLSVSALGGVWTASSGLMHVMKALNKAYDYKKTRSFLKSRLLAILFTMILTAVIILVFTLLVFGKVIAQGLFDFINISGFFETAWPIFRLVISLVFMIITFNLLYMFGPASPKENKVNFKDALPGSIFVTIGWLLSSTLFSFYVNNFGKYSVTYGSLGGVIVFLLWLYISSIIIVLGGEINATITYFKTNNWTYDPQRSNLDKFLEEKDIRSEINSTSYHNRNIN